MIPAIRLIFSKIIGLKSLQPAFFLVVTLIFSPGCSGPDSESKRIIIGIQADVQTINPMFAFSVVEGHLIDLLFLKPAMEIWNDSLGIIEFQPMLAEKWEWNEDSSSITLYLRDDIFWSDGKPITVEDIIFSFDVYSDPVVESRFFGLFNNFNTVDGMQIDTVKTFNVISPKVLTINFKEDALPTLLDINLEIIPRHIWSKYQRNEIPQAPENFEPITSGPFKLSKWERESAISLRIDDSSFLYDPENIKEIALKILPDYKSRITQLKTGAIDLIDNVKSEDAAGLNESEDLEIISLRGRDYDYLGWNHIDPEDFSKSRIVPNKYFSSQQIRKALSYAINREEILESLLGEYGEICNGPVSPMFKTYFDNTIKTDSYNPGKAKEILKENGWEDKDNNGILEKGKREFRFDLYTNSGNPRRNYVATIVKNNLKAIGIDVNIQMLETGTFVDGLRKRNFDAWIAGWTIPIPIDLKPYWNSDQETGFLNFSSYKNQKCDEMLIRLQERLAESEKIMIYKRLQRIIYDDEPVTFLYWFDNIVAYNKRISEIKISMLGLVKNAWEWKVD